MKKLLIAFLISCYSFGSYANTNYSCSLKQLMETRDGQDWSLRAEKSYVQIRDSIFSNHEIKIYLFGKNESYSLVAVQLKSLVESSKDSQKLVGPYGFNGSTTIDKGILDGEASVVINIDARPLVGSHEQWLLECERL